MRIDFEKIVNHALATVVAGVVLSACVIVWREATSVQDRLRESEARQHATIEVMDKTVEDLSNRLKAIEEKGVKPGQGAPPPIPAAVPMPPILGENPSQMEERPDPSKEYNIQNQIQQRSKMKD